MAVIKNRLASEMFEVQSFAYELDPHANLHVAPPTSDGVLVGLEDVSLAVTQQRSSQASQPSRESDAQRRAKRRTGVELQKLTDAALREVARKPGQTLNELAKKLRVPKKALSLPMQRLLKAKKVKKAGVGCDQERLVRRNAR